MPVRPRREARLTSIPTPAFGRRATGRVDIPIRPPPAGAALSPEAEAFRAQLKGAAGAKSDFERWREETRLARWLAWAGSVGLAVSGVVTFSLHAPAAVSGALEVGGWGLGAWLRHARRARLAQVRAWEPDPLA